MIDTVLRDARFALRSLLRQPGFTVTALASIGLGIAAAATALAVVNAVYLRPLPYPDASRLVMIFQDQRGVHPYWTVAGGNYTEWKRRATSFNGMAAFNMDAAAIEGEVGTELVRSAVVTPGFFRVLGVSPALGSGFREEHATPGNEHVLVLSYGLWQLRFGGDPEVVGRSLVVDGSPHTILGVMPADYRHPELASARLWRPLALGDEAHEFYHKFLHVVARLRPGVSLDRARLEMEALARTLEEEVPEFNEGYGANVVSLRDELLGNARLPTRLLLGAAGFVLLLVVVNMAGLSVVRCQRRLPEFAVRAAMGASAFRVGRQVLTETLLLAGAGALLGLGLTALLMGGLQALASAHLTPAVQLDIDGAVLLLTLGTAALAGLAFGATPALVAARPNIRAWLSSGSPGSGGARRARRTREAFTAAALGVTVVALFSAILMTRSFIRLVGTDTGFEAEGVLTVATAPPADPYADGARSLELHRALLKELGSLPGVESVANALDLPFSRFNQNTLVGLPTETDEEMIPSEWKAVSDGYFDVLGIPVLAGSVALGVERRRASVVVNESLASRLWPGENPVGKRIRWGGGSVTVDDTLDIWVAGVVDDVLDDGFDSAPEPRLYAPHQLNPRRSMDYLLRTTGDFQSRPSEIRTAVARIDPRIVVYGIRPLAEVVSGTVAERRAVTLALSVFSVLALLLAGVGIYGVGSYNVALRRHELGVRAALGAGRGALRRLVLDGALRVTTVGLVIGVLLSVPATHVLEAGLFGVAPSDPVSYALVALLLATTALMASLVPARRAGRVNPIEALRIH